MNSRLGRSVIVGVFVAAVAGWTSILGATVPWALLAGVTIAVLGAGALWFLMQRAGEVQAWMKERFWAKDAGSFHAFGGVGLQVQDDGRHVWIDGQGLMRVLGRRETDDVIAARLTGMWRRDKAGMLMVRVDAVVQYLARMPERKDPRVQKFRRYLERDVLYPAEQRRRRA
jgi:hypothetical protein